MSKSGVAAKVAAAEIAAEIAAAKIVAAQIAAAWPGWRVWVTREGRSMVATRIGSQRPVDDDRWAKTVIADNGDELQQALVEQRSCDAARV
jgi:hypothetical protein